MSFMHYGFRLLLKVQYSGDLLYECQSAGGCRSLHTSPSFDTIDLNGGLQEVWILIAMALAYRLLAYFCLRRRISAYPFWFDYHIWIRTKSCIVWYSSFWQSFTVREVYHVFSLDYVHVQDLCHRLLILIHVRIVATMRINCHCTHQMSILSTLMFPQFKKSV